MGNAEDTPPLMMGPSRALLRVRLARFRAFAWRFRTLPYAERLFAGLPSVSGGEKPRNSDGRRSPGARGSGGGQEMFFVGDEGPQASGEVLDVVWIG